MTERKLSKTLLTSLLCTVGLFALSTIPGHAQTVANIPNKTPVYKWGSSINHRRPHFANGNLFGNIDEEENINNQWYTHILNTYDGNIWVKSNYLRNIENVSNGQNSPYQHIMKFQYTSQLYPSKAKDACEIASLKMGLSALGVKTPPLAIMAKRVPITHNPNTGYSASPFHFGNSASIYPKALVKVARQYGVHAKDITNASRFKIRKYLKQGHPVIFEGTNSMQYSKNSDHVLVLLGYSSHHLFYADPWSSRSKTLGWVNNTKFSRIFHSKKQGARAIVIWK